MEYPLLNISIKKWDDEHLMEYMIFDEFIYTDDDSIFNKFYRSNLFCDCNGRIFKVIRKAELKERWRHWFRFIPNVWKREIVFEPTGKSWSVDELRNHMLERISDLKNDEFLVKWKSDLQKAKTHSELLNGFN